MMAAFADAAPAWAAAGITPLPVYPDGKKTMVKQPEAFGRPAAMGLAAKPRYATANLGFMCGAFNRLTVVDVDSPADAELQHALATYGDSPIIVATPSGGRHVYYAHNDEPRKVRPDPGHPIDMLGGGLCVAPPSTRLSGASYAWQRGSLADIANGNLPKIRNGAVSKTRDLGHLPTGPRVQKGERNAQLFRYCRQIVGYCDDLDALIDAARTWADSKCAEPLADAEIVATAYKVWKYQGGRRRVMQTIVESPLFQQLIADVEVLGALRLPRHRERPRRSFHGGRWPGTGPRMASPHGAKGAKGAFGFGRYQVRARASQRHPWTLSLGLSL